MLKPTSRSKNTRINISSSNIEQHYIICYSLLQHKCFEAPWKQVLENLHKLTLNLDNPVISQIIERKVIEWRD